MNSNRIILFLLLGLSLGLFQACKSKTATASKQHAMHVKGGKPEKPGNFEPGCKLLPKADLVKAIAEAKATKAIWKIPVSIQRGQLGGVASCYLAVKDGLSELSRVNISLDDSRLGISLSGRMRERCGEGSTCQMWLIGTWGAVIEMPGTSDSDQPTFAIHSVVDAPKGAPTTNAKAFVYIQK